MGAAVSLHTYVWSKIDVVFFFIQCIIHFLPLESGDYDNDWLNVYNESDFKEDKECDSNIHICDVSIILEYEDEGKFLLILLET